MVEEQSHVQLGTATVGLTLHASIALSRDDRRRHLYIIGKTGTGKSTLLFNLMHADRKRQVDCIWRGDFDAAMLTVFGIGGNVGIDGGEAGAGGSGAGGLRHRDLYLS